MNDSFSPMYSNGAALDPAVTAGIVGFVIVAAIIAYIIQSIFLAMVFKKAGVEGWKAWVPVYNYWILLELGDQPGWISLLLLTAWIPVLGFVTAIVATVYIAIACYKIGLKFGKSGAFVLLAIFLPLVWLIWLAFDKTAVWRGGTDNQQAVPAGPASASAPVADTSAINDQPPTTPPEQLR